VIMVDELVLNQ